MRQVLEQSLGPDFLTYLAHLHSTNTQSDLINFGWNHSSGPLSQAEAEAICKYAFVCPPTTVAPTGSVPSASGHSAVPFRMKDIFADHTWLFTGSPEAGVCPALGASPVTVATFARELRQELLSSQVRDEVVLGHYLRRMLRGPVLQELNRKIANISALEMKVRAGTMTFSDYEEALHRCIPVGTEAVLIRQTCSFLRRPRERLSDAFHRFEGSVRD
jgi:hypothetical protein